MNYSFDFEGGHSISYNETVVRTFNAQLDGTFEALLMWWELDMDGAGEHVKLIDVSVLLYRFGTHCEFLLV